MSDDNLDSLNSMPTMKRGQPLRGEVQPRSLDSAATMRPSYTPQAERRLKAGDSILGRYTVVSELGQGGMGVVYKCLDTVGGVEVAVKSLPPELSHNTLEMEDIRDNYQLVCGLRHPGIVGLRTLERNPDSGDYYLVMDLVDGIELRRWLRRHPDAPLADKLRILRQVASALDYAHERRIIHRDVKPGNVMVSGDGSAHVLDFGLAAQIRTSLSRVSMAYRGTSGTGPYMAPEQWRGQAQGASADQYSLGVMAYEIFAGHLPFESSDTAVLKQAVLDETPAPIAGLPPPMMGAIRKAMSKDAKDRYASCAEFVAALSNAKTPHKGGGRRAVAVVCGLLALVGVLFAVNGYRNRQKAEEARAKDEAARMAEVQKAEAERKAEEEIAKSKAEAERKAAEELARQEAERKSAEEIAKAREEAVRIAEAERKAQDAAAELAVFDLSIRAENAHNRINGESDDVKAFFQAEIMAFENDRRSGDSAKALSKNVTATNYLTAALSKAKALRVLVDGRVAYLEAAAKAENIRKAADAVAAETAFALRYGEARKQLETAATAAQGRDFASAITEAEKAAGQFAALRADVVKVTLDDAKRHRDAGRWEECLAAAEKVLGWEVGDAEATALKTESANHIKPSARLTAKIGDREVFGAIIHIGAFTYKLPGIWSQELCEKGRFFPDDHDYQVEYQEEGKNYIGFFRGGRKVDWRGQKTFVVELAEQRGEGSYAGEVREIEIAPGVKMAFVWVAPGSFRMGSDDSDAVSDEKPVHQVTLTKGYWLGKYEVTQKEWQSVMRANPSFFKGDRLPVEEVSWDDCQEFVKKVNAYLAQRGEALRVRLPTEAEWEFAARGGTKRRGYKYSGGNDVGTVAWYYGNSGRKTHEVGAKAANELGIHDMSGNVWEWCADGFGAYPPGAVTDPLASGRLRVNRGGSFIITARYCRSAHRYDAWPRHRSNGLGVRLAAGQ